MKAALEAAQPGGACSRPQGDLHTCDWDPGGEEGVEGSKEFREIKADFFFSNLGKSINVHSESQNPDPVRCRAPHVSSAEQNCRKRRGQRKQREKAGDRRRVQ